MSRTSILLHGYRDSQTKPDETQSNKQTEASKRQINSHSKTEIKILLKQNQTYELSRKYHNE